MQLQERRKLFLDNFIVYGLGGMLCKLIPMIMLPIITRLYPSSEFIGLNDLSQTLISFAQAIAICGMYDAMFRLFFDYETFYEQKEVCSTSLWFVTVTTVVITILMYLLRDAIAKYYFGNSDYVPLVVVTIVGFTVSSTNQIVSAPTRIQNKRKVFLITNAVSSLLSYSIAIPLILRGHYLISIPLAHVIAVLTIEVTFVILNHEYFDYNCFDYSKFKEMFKIGIALLPNFLIYWIYHSADRIMITRIIDAEATGVYSVAARIGGISNLIYTAFAGGWQYFAFSTMHDDDQVQLKSNIYEYLAVISFACTILLMSVSNILFDILFPAQYQEGFVVAPYLFLAPLLLMLYQVAANQFTIIKKTYYNMIALLVGAMVNIVLNKYLISTVGIEGAAIATIAGYFVSNATCILVLKKIDLFNINKRVFITCLILVVYYILWRMVFCDNLAISILLAIIAVLVYTYLYRKEVVAIIQKNSSREI